MTTQPSLPEDEPVENDWQPDLGVTILPEVEEVDDGEDSEPTS